jgi:hypothetical protein
MAERDHPPLTCNNGRVEGRYRHGRVAYHRQDLVDLIAFPNLDLERVLDLAAHEGLPILFLFCSQSLHPRKEDRTAPSSIISLRC